MNETARNFEPAGDLERLKFAVLYGADAVYVGATEFGMRSAPKNFTMEQLAEGVRFAHARGRRVYLTLNTVPTNEEIARMPDFMRRARETGVDAFIVADLGVLAMAKHIAPEMELHVSTQAGIANYAAASAAYDLGAKRVVLARELSLNDIAVIRDNTPPELELEAFVHGAMCMSVSGAACFRIISPAAMRTGENARSPPLGSSLPRNSAGRAFEVGETEEGSYILNADDLCTAPFIDLILQAGVDSLKIEGRAKTFYYVASTTSAYRRAVNAYLDAPDAYMCPEDVLEELTRTSHRHYSTGFYFGREGATQNTKHGGYIREWEVVGVVDEWREGTAFCTQRGKFLLGEALEALAPSGKVVAFTPEWIQNESGEAICATPHAMMRFSIPCTAALPEGTILRRQGKRRRGVTRRIGAEGLVDSTIKNAPGRVDAGRVLRLYAIWEKHAWKAARPRSRPAVQRAVPRSLSAADETSAGGTTRGSCPIRYRLSMSSTSPRSVSVRITRPAA